MRLFPAVAVLVSSSLALAQADLWSHVSQEPNSQQLSDAHLSDQRLQAVHRVLRLHKSSIGWECAGDDFAELLKGLTFEAIPLAGNQDVVLAQAGAGCGRGGQGANGAMLLIRFDGDSATLIATPKQGFAGWLFSIEPTTSRGYHDVILGWNMGADQGSLNYFRFDGKSYRAIGSATYTVDEQDKWHIVPIPK